MLSGHSESLRMPLEPLLSDIRMSVTESWNPRHSPPTADQFPYARQSMSRWALTWATRYICSGNVLRVNSQH